MGSVIMRIIQCSIVMSILWSVALGQPDILIQDSFDSFHEEWDVHDPDSKITLDFTIDERLEFENWIRYDEGYVLQMITPISDFTFDYTFQISAVGGNGKSVGPCISDSQGSLTDMASGNGIYLLYSGYNGSGIAIYTVENGSLVYDVGTGSNKINVSVGTTYFVGFEKSGDQLNLSVYTDSERTSHLAGSPVSITSNFGDTEFNSFHAINSWVSPVEGNWEWSTGWIDDITLKTDNSETIAYWDAENISGTDVPDESGNGHNGTLVNGAVQTTSGLVGNGIYLDGIDDYVEIPATGDLNSTSTQFTAEAWIYPNNLNHNGWIMGRNGNWFMLIHDDGTINYATNYNEQWNIPANVQINEWQHVALTYDGTEMKFYFNGQLLHSTPYSEPVMQHGDPVVIGLDAINPSNFFHGVVDDVRLSNVALEPHEFLNSGIFQETETLAHWTFDEGSGSEVYDQTGNGHTGTLHNGASWTAGINSGALDFDGVDDYVNVPSNFLWGLQSGTIEVILNPDVIDSDNWFFAYAMDTHHGVSMCVDNSRSACVQFNGGGGEVYRGSPDQVFENEWVHLAVSWDGNVVNSYINGVVDYETSDSGIPTEEPQALIFGADSYFRETYSFDGKIDEIRISSGILQPEQFLRFESLLNTAIVSTPTQYTQPGQTLAVPIQIALPNEVGVSAIELSFSGFDQWLQFESVSLEGTLAGAYGWSAESNLQGNSINLALYGANAFIGEGILCNLNFTCLDVGASQFALEFLNGLIDTGELDIHFDSGTIFINSPNYGDVDLNGHIQAFDASMIMKHLSGIVTLNEQQLLNSDVSGIEGITAYDAALVAKYVVGLIDDFPVMNGSGSLNAAGELSIADIDVTDPLYFDVPFNFNDLSNVTSLELSMDYPSDKLDYQGIVWPESLLPFMKEINISNGHISLVAAHSSQLLSGNIEVRLQFGISSSFEAGEVVYFTSDQFKLNENINIIEPIRGSIYNTVGLDDQFVGIPTEFSVMPNIPNPFNPSTTIRYGLPEEANISLVVYDIRGNLVQTLKSDHQSSGWYDVVWNGQTADGKTTSTGIYFARLVASDYSQVIKMLYLK